MSFHPLNHHNMQDREHFQLSTHSLALGSLAILSFEPSQMEEMTHEGHCCCFFKGKDKHEK